MNDEQIYLYGVMAKGSASALGAGIDGAEVYGLECDDLEALVSRIQPDSVDFQADAILAHQGVLMSAMQVGTVIPVAFGHLFPTEAQVCELLETAAAELHSNLAYLADRVEVGVKATWRKENFLTDIETPQLQELIGQAQQPAADQSLTLVVGELVETLITKRRDEYVAEICHKLDEGALEMRLNEPLTTRMVFNAAFLIERDSQDSFFQLVNQVASPHGDRLDFHYSGPWPPHNFSQLHITK